jgi:hypothetical protein
MTHRHHPDDASDPRLPPRLAEDLTRLYDAPVSIPPEVDRAVRDAAWRHCDEVRARRWIAWWARAGAAAAAIFIGISLYNVLKTPPAMPPIGTPLAGVRDIDRNGHVNILDAFRLAKKIEEHAELDRQWDMNGDGIINQADVDAIAMSAVRLDRGT